MGYEIWIIDDEGNRDSAACYAPNIGDLTYNYTAHTECHKYWKPKRDFDEKTVGEAIVNLERATAQMIADGYLEKSYATPVDIRLGSMLDRMFELYSGLIRIPRHYRIELES